MEVIHFDKTNEKAIGYVDDSGSAWINTEYVARNLGLSKQSCKNGVVYDNVRWDRVRKTLKKYGIEHNANENGFVPENVVKKLCSSLRNETAVAFRSRIDDIVLSIKGKDLVEQQKKEHLASVGVFQFDNVKDNGNPNGYIDDNGKVWVNAECVARGWGFTHIEYKNGKMYDTVRWSVVNEYIREFSHFLPEDGEIRENDYLPEEIVYRLGFKAKNDIAVKFQMKLANEILPSIRKTGSYSVNGIILPNFENPAEAAREWARQYEQRVIAEQQVKHLSDELEEAKPKIEYCDAVLSSPNAILVRQIAQDFGMTAQEFNKLLHTLGVQFSANGTWILYSQYKGNGYTKSETNCKLDANGNPITKIHMKWTEVGRKFLYDFLKQNGIFPVGSNQIDKNV